MAGRLARAKGGKGCCARLHGVHSSAEHRVRRAEAAGAARRDDPAPSVVAQTTIRRSVSRHAQSTHRAQPATRRYLYETMNDKEKHTVLSRMVSQGVMATPKAEATGRWRRGGRDT
jgi:hypothetical protein